MENIWTGDKLDRKSDALYIQRYLENLYTAHKREEGFVLNVNSRWGGGKTFFLERLENQLKSAGYVTVFYSAWRNDYSSEPLISFVASIEEALSEKLPKALKSKAKGIAKLGLKAIKPLIPAAAAVLVRQLTGLSIEKLIELTNLKDGEGIDSKDKEAAQKIFSDVASKTVDTALADYKNSKTSMDDFHKKLSDLVAALEKNDEQLPIFVFIDELDRCRPTFSIELLECIKHLFSVRGMYFIVATDTEQLSHSINSVYGEKFESERYLKRFFDVEYSFKKPNYKEFVSYLSSRSSLKESYYIPIFKDSRSNDYKDAVEVIASIFTSFSLELRDQEQAYFAIHNILLVGNYDKVHLIFLTFLVSLKIKNLSLYSNLRSRSVDGVIPEDVKNIYKGGTVSFITYMMLSASGSKLGSVSLHSILELYVQLAATTDKEIHGWDYEEQDNLIGRQIVSEVQEGVSFSTRDVVPRLSDYFDLVEQAGRLSFPQSKSAQ